MSFRASGASRGIRTRRRCRALDSALRAPLGMTEGERRRSCRFREIAVQIRVPPFAYATNDSLVDQIRLRRGVVEHRVRAGGLHESIDERDQRDSHPHPSGRRPVAPLSSYGPSVMRRRRDVTAGAPSSGSRVRLCSLHHVTPADDAPRCCMYCVFLTDHRLSNSGSIFVGTPGADRFVLPLHRVPSMVGCRTPHLAPGAGGACRTAPIRWSKVMR